MLPDLLTQCRSALDAARAYEDAARQAVAGLTSPAGRLDTAALEHNDGARSVALARGFFLQSGHLRAPGERLFDIGQGHAP